MCLNPMGELSLTCDRENREWWSRKIKAIYIWYLELVAKRLCCINSLNA